LRHMIWGSIWVSYKLRLKWTDTNISSMTRLSILWKYVQLLMLVLNSEFLFRWFRVRKCGQ
jgi:hypothetical protein